MYNFPVSKHPVQKNRVAAPGSLQADPSPGNFTNPGTPRDLTMMNQAEAIGRYEVLSPWSEIDPLTLHAPATRLDTIEGKRIGLFCNFKRSAQPMLETAAHWLQERFPTVKPVFYRPQAPNVPEMESAAREQFSQWIDSVDGVILAVGD